TAGETPRYGEPDAAPGAMWSTTSLTALFAADADIEAGMRDAAHTLGLAPPAYTLQAIADLDWVRHTQSQFGPMQVADRLWVVPSWSEIVDTQAINIKIDPGLAFGTGSHATTRLCLRWLAAHLAPGSSLLDYGCGSGILAIAAARLGADAVTGCDVDPAAIVASRANAERNGVVAQLAAPDAIGDGSFDVVVANILANPLRLLAPLLAARVRPGGSIVLSGILQAQAAPVIEAYARWFKLATWGEDDGWIALVGRRQHD
ncbi:MAG TPA: 50S ribosomal protein L11 methyltransferase, partial [Casimicrobiaceae bacterium]|nr:50S ribosomal protein L11 methyltransferase [Casimicrobiaceae bacterium]